MKKKKPVHAERVKSGLRATLIQMMNAKQYLQSDYQCGVLNGMMLAYHKLAKLPGVPKYYTPPGLKAMGGEIVEGKLVKHEGNPIQSEGSEGAKDAPPSVDGKDPADVHEGDT